MQETVNRDGHDEVEASKAPLMDHLIELRTRLIYALIGVGIGFVICFAFAADLYNLLVWPYLQTKLDREYSVFQHSVTILLWAFAVAMIVLAGAHWTARQDRPDPLS